MYNLLIIRCVVGEFFEAVKCGTLYSSSWEQVPLYNGQAARTPLKPGVNSGTT